LAVKQIIRYSASREKNATANADESSFKFIVYRQNELSDQNGGDERYIHTFIHFPDFLPLNETTNCLIIDIFANIIIDAINIFVKKNFLYFALI